MTVGTPDINNYSLILASFFCLQEEKSDTAFLFLQAKKALGRLVTKLARSYLKHSYTETFYYSSGEAEESPTELGKTSTVEDNEHKGLQGVLQQRNFLRNVNPRDPLNVNLRRAFLEYDKDLWVERLLAR